jgi:hypothetical protein
VPSAVEAKIIDVGTEGSPYQLGVELEAGGLEWFQLGEAGNARVAADYRAFLLSARPGRYEAKLAASWSMLLIAVLLGVAAPILYLFLESWDRVELWAEGGRMRITSRRRLVRRRATGIDLEAGDRFEVVDEGGESGLAAVVFRRGPTRQELFTGRPRVMKEAAARLERFAKEHGKVVEEAEEKEAEAEGPAPPTKKGKKKRKR